MIEEQALKKSAEAAVREKSQLEGYRLFMEWPDFRCFDYGEFSCQIEEAKQWGQININFQSKGIKAKGG